MTLTRDVFVMLEWIFNHSIERFILRQRHANERTNVHYEQYVHMTDFHVDVVKLGPVRDLENSDALSITEVHGGFPCIVRRGSFKEGDLAVYVPIETTLPDVPEFSFLAASDRRRLKAKKLRGTFSMGLLVPARPEFNEGDDVADALGIKKFEPGTPKVLSSEAESEPTHFSFMRYTDIEPLRRNMNVLQVGEDVVITEKLHGANFRACHDNERLWVASHNIVRKDGDNVWWNVARTYDLETRLSKYPFMSFFFELHGTGIQDLNYGGGPVRIRLFDVQSTVTGNYVEHSRMVKIASELQLEIVPVLKIGPWSLDDMKLCEGPTTLGGSHVREGFVVKPATERWDRRCGRVILKHVGEGYHMRKQ